MALETTEKVRQRKKKKMEIKIQEETVMSPVRTSVLWVWWKLTTFMAEAPWRTIRESLLEIIQKLRWAGRVTNQIAARRLGVIQRRARTQASPNQVSRKAIA